MSVDAFSISALVEKLRAEHPALTYAYETRFETDEYQVSFRCEHRCWLPVAARLTTEALKQGGEQYLRGMLRQMPCAHIKEPPSVQVIVYGDSFACDSPAMRHERAAETFKRAMSAAGSGRILHDREDVRLHDWEDEEPTGEHDPVALPDARVDSIRRRLRRRYGASTAVTIKLDRPAHIKPGELWVSLACNICDASAGVLIRPDDDTSIRTAVLVGMFELSEMSGETVCSHFPPSTEASHARLDAEESKRECLVLRENIQRVRRERDQLRADLEAALRAKQPQLARERTVLVDIED